MTKAKILCVFLGMFLLSACDYFDKAQKYEKLNEAAQKKIEELQAKIQSIQLKHDAELQAVRDAARGLQEKYKGELAEAQQKFKQLASDLSLLKTKYNDDLRAAELKIRNLDIDLEKARAEVRRTRELHKKMLE